MHRNRRVLVVLAVFSLGTLAAHCRSKSAGSDARIVPPAPEPAIETEEVAEEQGGEGARAAGDEGKIGQPGDVDRLAGVQGPTDGRGPYPGSSEMLEQIAGFGPVEELGAAGLGIMGTVSGGPAVGGVGGGVGHGYGSGSGRARSRSAPPAPDLRLGAARTTGSLSKEVIRRVVTQHRGRLRYCYEAALRTNPQIAGGVTVGFAIGPQGDVQTAEIAGNTSSDDTMGGCLASVFKHMIFPQGDGITSVTYPLSFLQTAGGAGGAGQASCTGPDAVALDCPDVDEFLVIETPSRDRAPAEGGPPPATQGTLRAKSAEGEITGEFPLGHTEVSAEISGYIARTDVEQQYSNPFTEVIEAVYVFPLPASGAINDFVMQIGDRKIVGLIRPREEAERLYAEARARGRTASLLTQERTNIFTQNVANIEPGGEVTIRITFFERLEYESGYYEWVYPMVVGPRYVPGTPQPSSPANDDSPSASAAPAGGGGTSPPTSRVGDADRITPPVLRPGERSGHDIGLTVTLDAGLPISRVAVPTHDATIDEPSAAKRVIRLSQADSIPNRDFVVRWSVAGAETQFGVLAHRGETGGYLTLMMQPPLEPPDDQVTPREITFILDVSGSMSGVPLGISKAVVLETLAGLRPDDRFNVFYFAAGNGQLWESAKPKTEANLAAAKEFVGNLCGGGGTEMLDGLRRAMEADHDPTAIQMYVFLTDGYVGGEDEILTLVKTGRGSARFFAFGIGGSVNRMLIEGIAENGGGASDVVLSPGEGEGCRVTRRLFAMIDSPVLVDVGIDWNGLPVTDIYPARLPDLFAGGTINVVARFTTAAAGTAYVTGRVGSRRVRLPVAVALPGAEPANAALAPIWARWRIEDLAKSMLAADEARQAEIKTQITGLAVEYRLVSQYTAFVAVDESRAVGDGRPLRVIQPVELPAGVSYEGVFGEAPAGEVDLPVP